MRVRPSGWQIGCPALLVLWGLSARAIAPQIEADLRAELAASRARLGGDAPLASRIEVAGRDVAIVADPGLAPELLETVADLARRLPGARRVSTATAVAIPLDPYPFTVRRSRSAIVLEGGSPSAGTRVAVLRDVASRAPGLDVDDRLRPATGEPAGFDAAAAALLGAALDLAEAEGAISGSRVTFRGVAEDEAGYVAARGRLARLPPGFQADETAIEPPLVHPWSWSVARQDDSVTLGGFAPSEADRAAILAAASAAWPGARVDDRTRTARGGPDGAAFRAAAQAGLAALADLAVGRMELRDRQASLSGRAQARDRLPAVAAAFRGALPAGIAPETVDLAAIPADPYVFSVARAAGRVTLAGFAPDEAERSVLLDLARRRFPAEAIVDDLHLADGAPEDVAVAQALALAQLAQMAEGRVALSGRAYAISGRVLYAELASRLRDRAEAGLPPGWRVSADLTAPPGRLQAQVCGDLVGEALRRDPVRFAPGSQDAAPGQDRGLASVAAILARCGPARVRVTASAPRGADPAALALARARAEQAAARLSAGRDAGIALASGVRESAGPGGPEIVVEVEPADRP